MEYAAQVEKRLDFALNSPDFWRGLIIALSVLTVAMVVRVLVVTLRSPKVEPTTSSRWTQASGLASYGLLASVVASIAFDKLGNVAWSWRLVVSVVAIALGAAWAAGTLHIPLIPRFLRRKRTDVK